MPKISVIVPVYNVEKYLERCIESVLNQTFVDFELILVDDGSPDGCGEICDKYAEKDGRVHVIHKQNGGLSDARNAGIDWALSNSDSQWIGFVDSDDIVYENYLEYALKNAELRDADIVCFGIEMRNEQNELLDWGTMRIDNEEIYGYNDRFVPIIAPNSVGDYAVNKIYRKVLFDSVRYPNGMTFEDIYTTYKVFNKARRIIVIPNNLYIYIRRSDSITGIKNPNSILHILSSSFEKYSFIKQMDPKYAKNAVVQVADSASVIIRRLYGSKKTNERRKIITVIRTTIVDNWDFLSDNDLCSNDTMDICKSLYKGETALNRFMRKKILKTRYNALLERLYEYKHRMKVFVKSKMRV